MSIKESLLADMKAAMKEKDSIRLETVRMLRAAIQRKEVDDQAKIDDDSSLDIVRKLVKQGKDSAQQFISAGREDLAQKEQQQLLILEAYLPPQLDDAAIAQEVDKAIAFTGAKGASDMGKIMAQLKSLKDNADMGKVSQIVKAKLASL